MLKSRQSAGSVSDTEQRAIVGSESDTEREQEKETDKEKDWVLNWNCSSMRSSHAGEFKFQLAPCHGSTVRTVLIPTSSICPENRVSFVSYRSRIQRVRMEIIRNIAIR
jgi:hypothetical protein